MNPELTNKTPETDAVMQGCGASECRCDQLYPVSRSLETRLNAALAEAKTFRIAFTEINPEYERYGKLIEELEQDLTTLQQENEKLREDKARLDWLELAHHRPEWLMNLSQDARQEIDKAMKDYHSTLTKEQI